MTTFGQNFTDNDLRWITKNVDYDGFPLYLRHPDYNNIKVFKPKYHDLLCVTHKLDKVKDNGLPESDYNKSLIDFDGDLCNLFDIKNSGIIILIETYAGERNYWYYIADSVDYQSKIDEIRVKYKPIRLETELSSDKEWGFLSKYPIPLYKNDK